MNASGHVLINTADDRVIVRPRSRSGRLDRTGTLIGFALAATLTACGGSGGDDSSDGGSGGGDSGGGADPVPSGDDECNIDQQNDWVYENMRDYYLFYDQVPTVDPGDYPSPEALLQEIRFQERDRFSHVTDASEATLEFEAGREFGLGYRFGYYDADAPVPRIMQVEPDGPFGRAGIERGDIIVSINEIPAATVLLSESYDDYFFDEVLGAPEAPATSEWTLRDRETDVLFTRTITSTEYSIETVPYWSTFTNPSYDGNVGYVSVERFLETSEDEIDAAFDQLRDASITDLVLDLRYNHGGRIYVAEKLASLIAGSERRGQLLQRYRYNDKYSDENYALEVRGDVEGLDLRQLVVLVDFETASASELIISGLDALMDVTVLGNTSTVGKPYIQAGRDRCDQRLNAVEAEGFNANDESVFGGIEPDCLAFDDFTRQLGKNPETDEIEGMLVAGLERIAFNTCEPYEPLAAKRKVSRESSSRQGFYPRGGANR